MDFKDFSPLSKNKWFVSLQKAYFEYLIRNNFPINKSIQLTTLFGWHVELIYYYFGWNLYYPEWSLEATNGSAYRANEVKKLNHQKSIFYKPKNLIARNIKLILIRLVLLFNSKNLYNVHLRLKWDLIRLKIIKRFLPKTEENAYKVRDKFLDKYLICEDNKIFSENLKRMLPIEFFINQISLPHSKFEINCEQFLFRESISLLMQTKGLEIINHTHGSTAGWLIENYFDKRWMNLSVKTVYWEYQNPQNITRYYIKPKKKSQKNRRVLWISRANLIPYLYEMTPAIDYKIYQNIEIHLETIYRVIKDTKYYFVDHKKKSLDEYKLYKNLSSKVINFDPKSIFKNDIFIFDTIYSSLIFYAKKHSINFIIYESNFYKNTTPRFNAFKNKLEENKELFIKDEILFQKRLNQLFFENKN